MAAAMIGVRDARPGDLARIMEIYNHEVLTGTSTFDTVQRSMAEQEKWWTHHGAAHPVIVAEEASAGAQSPAAVVGWASLSPWSDRPAYARSVEVSVYVDAEHRGRGIGRALLAALVDRAQGLGHHALLARITSENRVSIRMHESLGFFAVGTLREVGRKFDPMLDVLIMERVLSSSNSPSSP